MTAAPTPANGSRRKPWGELSQPSGFTLLEILVALVVLGLLMIGLTEGTRLGLRTIETQARLTDRTAGLDAVERTLRTLIGGLEPGVAQDPPRVVGTASELAFTARLPEGAEQRGDTGLQDVELIVDDGHRLILRWTPHRHVARRQQLSPAEAVLLDGVARLEIAYRTRENPTWQRSWDNNAPPALVRISLLFPPGDNRRWPALVIAPRRDRPQS